MKSNLLRLVTAGRDSVRIELVRTDGPSSSTVLASWTFDRVTADIHLLWTVDGRKSLTVAERIKFAFYALKMTSRICA